MHGGYRDYMRKQGGEICLLFNVLFALGGSRLLSETGEGEGMEAKVSTVCNCSVLLFSAPSPSAPFLFIPTPSTGLGTLFSKTENPPNPKGFHFLFSSPSSSPSSGLNPNPSFSTMGFLLF